MVVRYYVMLKKLKWNMYLKILPQIRIEYNILMPTSQTHFTQILNMRKYKKENI